MCEWGVPAEPTCCQKHFVPDAGGGGHEQPQPHPGEDVRRGRLPRLEPLTPNLHRLRRRPAGENARTLAGRGTQR